MSEYAYNGKKNVAIVIIDDNNTLVNMNYSVPKVETN